jgi:hypothetical protein
MITSSTGVPANPRALYGAGALPAFSDSTIASAAILAGTPKGPAAGRTEM